jgi:hypothetical protein
MVGLSQREETTLASRLFELVQDCHDAKAQAAFWAAVLDYSVMSEDDYGIEIGAWPTEPPDLRERFRAAPGPPTIVFTNVHEGKAVKNRLHIDVSPYDRSTEEEVERLVALGATRLDIGQGDDVSWVVLADPEGNEFCVLRSLA